ncbi:spt16 [Symbiodinium sp. CCMP2456]|nr:spt16 [Symbiodinium sp. CCMP2456]
MMERGTKRPLEDDNNEMTTAATLDQVSDVRLEFGEVGDPPDDSMPANSILLRLASPVFNRMLQSGMMEAQQSVIRVDLASKEEFKIFYNLLAPTAWSTGAVTKENVDSLLAISDYYQVVTIKQACEAHLLRLPATATRLLQARKHGLKSQYERCVRVLAKQGAKEDLELLRKSEPDILLEVAVKQQELRRPLVALKDEILRCKNLLPEPAVPAYQSHAFTAGRKLSEGEASKISRILESQASLKHILEKLHKELQ